tara:strand:- start:19054 stop:19473 length:420 start_codon:yes stop_codon:yes gene_type:complete
MEWLNNRLGQIIAGVTVAGTLAGFGFEGARVMNQIENMEASLEAYMSSSDQAFAHYVDIVDILENRVIILEEQMDALDVPDIGTIEKDIVALKGHGHAQQKMPDLSGIISDVSVLQASVTNLEGDIKELKDKSDNPLAN